MDSKRGLTYYILTLEVPDERAEEMSAWLTEEWDLQPVLLQKPNHARAWLEIYYESLADAEAARLALRRRNGVRAAQVRRCDPRDWLSFWRHHFHAQNLGRRLRICPVWEKKKARVPGRKTILVDPGASFGTGDHFTTRFCLEMLDRLCQKTRLRSVLDMGTGSGILAIGAAKLGCPKVLGVDNDELALRQAVRNVRLNRASASVKLAVGDVVNDPIRGRYDAVCANIIASVLVEVAPKLVSAAGRYLMLSGIREVEADGVADTFISLGVREVVRDGDGEWVGLMFETRKKQKRQMT